MAIRICYSGLIGKPSFEVFWLSVGFVSIWPSFLPCPWSFCITLLFPCRLDELRHILSSLVPQRRIWLSIQHLSRLLCLGIWCQLYFQIHISIISPFLCSSVAVARIVIVRLCRQSRPLL